MMFLRVARPEVFKALEEEAQEDASRPIASANKTAA
jgi:hypothetical protein